MSWRLHVSTAGPSLGSSNLWSVCLDSQLGVSSSSSPSSPVLSCFGLWALCSTVDGKGVLSQVSPCEFRGADIIAILTSRG